MLIYCVKLDHALYSINYGILIDIISSLSMHLEDSLHKVAIMHMAMTAATAPSR